MIIEMIKTFLRIFGGMYACMYGLLLIGSLLAGIDFKTRKMDLSDLIFFFFALGCGLLSAGRVR